MPITITPRRFHPEVELFPDGRLRAARDALSSPGDPFASGLEFAAIAADDLGRPLLAAARAPLAWQARLVHRIERALAGDAMRGDHRRRFEAAAATVLLDIVEGAGPRHRSAKALRRRALAAHVGLALATPSTRLRESMVVNLDRCRGLLDDEGRAALHAAWQRILPPSPPYDVWFPDGSGTLHMQCQVQDVFFRDWQRRFRQLGFAADGAARPGHVRFVREDVVGRHTTRFVVDYVQKGEGIFTRMADPRTEVVAFLGHSDWWARVPRNLARAPDQVGAKLLILIMCFGKHFVHALRERYPQAHVVTTKDPTEDPEDQALLRHLFDGIAARRSWTAIRRAAIADRTTADNFIFPNDARYVAGVADEDRDGRLDRFDRYCNLATPTALEPAGLEASFVADPPGLHPRGAELDVRELDGGKVFEAALMLNSLSYDNYWLDQVNLEQRVVAGGWHHSAPGEVAATRMTQVRRDGHELVRLTCSVRYARASQPALTAMVVYEGWHWLAARLPVRRRPSPRDQALMGIMLVAHSLANSDYHDPDGVFRAFVRRWGFPAYIRLPAALASVEHDPAWESGAPRAVTHFAAALPPAALARLERVLDHGRERGHHG